jgi:hypothetical protein
MNRAPYTGPVAALCNWLARTGPAFDAALVITTVLGTGYIATRLLASCLGMPS